MKLFEDTTPEALEVYFDGLRNMSPDDRFKLALSLSERVESLVDSGVRMRHPDYDDQMVQLAVARIRFGEEVFRRCFPGVDIVP